MMFKFDSVLSCCFEKRKELKLYECNLSSFLSSRILFEILAYKTHVMPLLESGKIKMTNPEKPKSPKQLFYSE